MAKASDTPELTAKQARELLRYEPETGKLFWLQRSREMFPTRRHWLTWNARYGNTEAFITVASGGYRKAEIFTRPYQAHRVAWLIKTGAWPVDQIDHINGNKSDNRWANLRAVSNAENGRNQKRRKNNTSGVTGVTWHKGSGKWQAQVMFAGKSQHLGRFDTVEAALAARAAANDRLGFSDRHGT